MLIEVFVREVSVCVVADVDVSVFVETVVVVDVLDVPVEVEVAVVIVVVVAVAEVSVVVGSAVVVVSSGVGQSPMYASCGHSVWPALSQVPLMLFHPHSAATQVRPSLSNAKHGTWGYLH